MMKNETKPAEDGQNLGIGPDGKPDGEIRDGAATYPAEGDFAMRIAADGTWFHQGRPIHRKPLAKLFSSILKRDAAGVYWLETPVERGRIEVEDAPFVAVECLVQGEGRDQVLRFRTSLDDWFEAGPANPIRVALDPDSGAPRPYVTVRDGLEALILRSVYYDLVDRALAAGDDEADFVGLWSHGSFFPLG